LQGRDEGRTAVAPILRQSSREDILPGLEAYAPEQQRLVRAAFDQDFYLAANPDLSGLSSTGALAHYLRFGWCDGRDPSPDFSTQFYLDQNPDVRQAGVNPFVHWVLQGRQEGRFAVAPVEPDCTELYELPGIGDGWRNLEPRIRAEFDQDFYISRYPDVATDFLVDPFIHYILYGWNEGRDPCEVFSTDFYLKQYQDVREANINPFVHWILQGRDEGRLGVSPAPEDATVLSDLPGLENCGIDLEQKVRAEFDSDFYLLKYPDVASQSHFDPFEHYLRAGWREGRDPSRDFTTQFYLDQNPDVSKAGVNPFVHWVVQGRGEGRIGSHPGGEKYTRLVNQASLSEMSRGWIHNKKSDVLLSAKEIANEIIACSDATDKRLIIAVSQDNFTKICGGSQLCVQREAALAPQYNTTYVDIYPWQPLLTLAKSRDDLLINVIIGLREVGVASIEEFIGAAKYLKTVFKSTDVVIHHTLGHSLEAIKDIVVAFGQSCCYYWIHDFFTICPSFALQRNGITFCGAPSVNSNACTVCVFSNDRIDHKKQMESFFDNIEVTLVAPSEVALNFWKKRSGLAAHLSYVIPHVTLVRSTQPMKAKKSSAMPVRIAYVGFPIGYKGWNEFCELASYLRDTPGYEFWYFGEKEPPYKGLKHIPVSVSSEDPNAMTKALAKHHIDIVFHWASCFETFSFTTYEAICAGCDVITNAISGNVAATVKKLGVGKIFNNLGEVFGYFDKDIVRQYIVDRRERRLGKLVESTFSKMIFSVLEKRNEI